MSETKQKIIDYFVGNAMILEVDEFSNWSQGNLIVRKDEKYGVMNQYSRELPTFSNYIFENPLKPINHN
ncbi:hypothetical protein ACWKSR_11950, partial [Campylobacter fetus subsp. venerealis]